MRATTTSVLLLLTACTSGPVTLTPAEGPASGYYRVVADVDPADVAAVTVGGIEAYDVGPVDGALGFTVQGGAPGDADVVVRRADGATETVATFRYASPIDPLFDRMVALGASLTQGVWDGTPSQASQLAGPAAVVARQAGAFFPLPLSAPDLFPRMQPSDVGPAPDCVTPDPVAFITAGVIDTVGKLVDPATGWFDYRRSRVTPDLDAANVAAGGFLIEDIVFGSRPGAVPQDFLGHLVFQPEGSFSDALEVAQLDLVEAKDPSIVMVTDLYGNDVILSFVGGPPDPSKVTPLDRFDAALDEGLARLAATDAEVFVANLPRVTFSAAALGKEGPELDAIVAAGLTFNEHLAAKAAAYPNVHVVDLFGWAERLAAEGIAIDGHVLTTQKLGGLVSIDGVHFTASGYGVMAVAFLDAIREATGVDVPPPDLGAIVAADDRSPWALAAAGVDPTACSPR